MRALLWFVLVALPAMSVAAGDTVAVVIFQADRPTVLALENQDRIGRLAVEMLASASYEAGPAVAEQGWLEAIRRPHLYVTFVPPRAVRVRSSATGVATAQELQVAEIVMRIVGEWPDYILVRERETVRAFAKFGPREAEALRDAVRIGGATR